MYVITYKDDGAVMSVGIVPDSLVKIPPMFGTLYLESLPDVSEGRSFAETYKFSNGQLVEKEAQDG